MQGIDQLIMQLYQAFTHLISFASLVMFSVVAYVVLVNGRSSTERTLIGIGAVLQAISFVAAMGAIVLQNLIPHVGFGQTTFIISGILHLA